VADIKVSPQLVSSGEIPLLSIYFLHQDVERSYKYNLENRIDLMHCNRDSFPNVKLHHSAYTAKGRQKKTEVSWLINLQFSFRY